MSTVKYPYRWSYKEAVRLSEEDLWRESHELNCECARSIEKAINDNYHQYSLNTDAAKQIIEEYGYGRVQFVLANTIQYHSEDGRFSPSNKEWAEQLDIPDDNFRRHYSVESHPGLVNLFIDRVRNEYQNLGLFDRSHCTDDKDYNNKLLVIEPSCLKDEYKNPDFQLFYAVGGFGCNPESLGQTVNGYFLKDGEFTGFRRTDFLGVIKDDFIPEWANEKLQELKEQETDNEIKMEGI